MGKLNTSGRGAAKAPVPGMGMGMGMGPSRAWRTDIGQGLPGAEDATPGQEVCRGEARSRHWEGGGGERQDARLDATAEAERSGRLPAASARSLAARSHLLGSLLRAPGVSSRSCGNRKSRADCRSWKEQNWTMEQAMAAGTPLAGCRSPDTPGPARPTLPRG